MLGWRYLKTAPTTYVFHYRRGRLRREGAGLAFWYYAPTSTLVTVPLASADLPFVFVETTNDFQTLTVQGQLSYRVVEPKRLSELLDFTIRPDGKYRSDDPELLRQRLAQRIQILTRAVTQRMSLREALTSSDTIGAEVLAGLAASSAVAGLGIEVMALAILSVAPTPEMGRALEAEAREALSRRADEAIYARRNAAVVEERTIKESELLTEIAVEEKKRQIRETQMAAEIAVEDQRAQLIDRQVQNQRKDAEARAYALETTLKPVRDLDWKTLMALGATGSDPRMMLAMAFRELAENAQKIGELNVTPDLLGSLMKAKG